MSRGDDDQGPLPWFRHFHDELNDERVCGLDDFHFRLRMDCVCIAARCDGRLPAAKIIADFYLRGRLTEPQTTAGLAELEARGLLVRHAGHLVPHDWARRRRKSDHSRDRTRSWRAGKSVTVTVTVTVTRRPEQTRSEQMLRRIQLVCSSNATPRPGTPGKPT
jgi:hypothetical protein